MSQNSVLPNWQILVRLLCLEGCLRRFKELQLNTELLGKLSCECSESPQPKHDHVLCRRDELEILSHNSVLLLKWE